MGSKIKKTIVNKEYILLMTDQKEFDGRHYSRCSFFDDNKFRVHPPEAAKSEVKLGHYELYTKDSAVNYIQANRSDAQELLNKAGIAIEKSKAALYNKAELAYLVLHVEAVKDIQTDRFRYIATPYDIHCICVYGKQFSKVKGNVWNLNDGSWFRFGTDNGVKLDDIFSKIVDAEITSGMYR